MERIAELLDVECGVIVPHQPLAHSVGPFGFWPSDPRIRTVVWNIHAMDARLLAEAKAKNIRNFAYGVQTPGEHRRCSQLSVDGVITDYPEHVVRECIA